MQSSKAITAILVAELREPGGPVLCRREARNTVLRSGAELIADLLSGRAAIPINAVAVGIDPEPSAPPYERSALTTALDGSPVSENVVQPISVADAEPEKADDDFQIKLRFRSVLPPGLGAPLADDAPAAESGEAALGVLAEDGQSLARIYNRVVFEPIPKRREHELSLYWEISIPYGG
jgi:hypothetical protein